MGAVVSLMGCPVFSLSLLCVLTELPELSPSFSHLLTPLGIASGTHWCPQPALPTPLGCVGMALRAVSGSHRVAWVTWLVPTRVAQHRCSGCTTAFLVLSKCHAQETGEIKVWQGIPVLYICTPESLTFQ